MNKLRARAVEMERLNYPCIYRRDVISKACFFGVDISTGKAFVGLSNM